MHELYFEREGFVPEDVGRKITEYCSTTLNQATEDIAASGLDCAHVAFSELTKDPIAMMRVVYKQFGWNFSKEYEANLVAYLAADEKKRKVQFDKAKSSAAKIHDPNLFNLDKDKISKQFSKYIELYGKLVRCLIDPHF